MKPYQGQFEPAVYSNEPIPLDVSDLHVIAHYQNRMIGSRNEWLHMCHNILPISCITANIEMVNQLAKSRS